MQHVLRKVRGFFAMSRSIVNRATCALNRAISACSDVTVGVAALPSGITANWPFASACTQFVRLALGIPSVAATADAARPALTCRTASCLNSSVYFALVCFSFNSCSRPRILRAGAMHSRIRGQPQFLLFSTEAGSWMTGACVPVDGGHLCSSL